MSLDGPLVVVLLRHTDLRPDVDPLTGAISRDTRSAGASASEWAALEHGLRIAESWSGRVLALVAGPPAGDETLRQARAAGAEVLRVPWPPGSYLEDLAADERALAVALVTAMGDEKPALVLCGDRSADRGTGALPAYVAHELGCAQALGLVSLVSLAAGTGRAAGLRAERRLDGGRREILQVPSPAVCSVEASGVRLRRASLSAMLASEAPVPVAAVPSEISMVAPTVLIRGFRAARPRTRVAPPPTGGPHDRLLELTRTLVTREPPTLVDRVDAAAAADALLGYLRRHGYLAESEA